MRIGHVLMFAMGLAALAVGLGLLTFNNADPHWLARVFAAVVGALLVYGGVSGAHLAWRAYRAKRSGSATSGKLYVFYHNSSTRTPRAMLLFLAEGRVWGCPAPLSLLDSARFSVGTMHVARAWIDAYDVVALEANGADIALFGPGYVMDPDLQPVPLPEAVLRNL